MKYQRIIIIAGILFISFTLLLAKKSQIKQASSTLSIEKSAASEIESRFKPATENYQLHQLRSALGQIAFQNNSRQNPSAMYTLMLGLKSDNPQVRRTTGALVTSLLIDVAHGVRTPDENLKPQLDILFSSLVKHSPEGIEEIRSSNPNSPTLTYLQNLGISQNKEENL